MAISQRLVDMYQSMPEPYREALVGAWILNRELTRKQAEEAGWVTDHMRQDLKEDTEYAVLFQRMVDRRLKEKIEPLAAKSLSELLVLQIEGDQNDRALKTLAIGKHEDPEATPSLVTLLQDGMPLVRGAAAWCLAERSGREISIKLVELLEDDDRRVRVLARRSLIRRFGEDLGPKPRPYLVKLEVPLGD